MYEDIQSALTGHIFSKQSTKIPGYLVSQLHDSDVPGMVKRPHSCANGYILNNVDMHSFATIKEWEGDEYSLELIPSDLVGGKICYTYMWTSNITGLLWDKDVFQRKHLQWYVDIEIPEYLKNKVNKES